VVKFLFATAQTCAYPGCLFLPGLSLLFNLCCLS
jgi:hypothetical protein